MNLTWIKQLFTESNQFNGLYNTTNNKTESLKKYEAIVMDTKRR